MKLKIIFIFCTVFLLSAQSWGQTWNMTPTMTATLDSNGVLTIEASEKSEAMPVYCDYSILTDPFSYGRLRDDWVGEYPPWHDALSKIRSIVLGDKVTTIDSYRAFQDCPNLTSVFIPNSVVAIGSEAFQNCGALKDITVRWGNPISCKPFFENSKSFAYVDKSKITLHIPVGTKALYEAADVWKDFGTIVEDGAPAEKQIWHLTSTMTATLGNDSILVIKTTKGEEGPGGAPIASSSIGYRSSAVYYWVKSRINSVIIEKGITSIGYYAFEGFNITSISIPNSVKTIGDCAFIGCSGFTSISIPNSVTTIGVAAFFGCIKLTSISIPNSVISIGGEAFSNCPSLKDVTVEWATPLPVLNYPFFDSNEIKTATLHVPYGTKSLYEAADVWKDFGTIVEQIPVIDVTGIELDKSRVYSVEKHSLKLNATVSPNDATNKKVIWSCSNEAVAEVSDSGLITTIAPGGAIITATTEDGNFTATCEIRVLAKFVVKNGVLVEYNGHDSDVVIPDNLGITEIGEHIFSCSLQSLGGEPYNDLYYPRRCVSSVVIPEGVTKINDNAFWGSIITSVTLPNSLKSIGNTAFFQCHRLSSITLPESLESIGGGAFIQCFFSAIKLPNSLKSIGVYAFSECGGLTSIAIPKSVASIGNGAFFLCQKLSSITVDPENSVYSSEDGVLYNKNKTTLHTYPDGKSDTEFSISNTITNILSYAFFDPKNLTSIIINWTTPLAVNRDIFVDFNLSTRTLYVPYGTKALYEAADVWKDFGTIIEQEPPTVAVSGISLNKTSVTLWIAENEQLTANVLPENATNRKVRWSSSNESIALVSDSGLVTAKAAGTASIIATSVDGGFTAICNVEVRKQEVEVEEETETGEDGKGTIVLSLTIPADVLFSGSFQLTLPNGIKLDLSVTKLAEDLASQLNLTIVQNADGSWVFTITPLSLRSVTDMVYSKILEIGYIANETVALGTYKAVIKDLSLEFENGASITEDELPVTITVNNIITGIPELNSNSNTYCLDGRLYIESTIAEKIQVYSTSGILLYNFEKEAGSVNYPITGLHGTVLIVRGNSGWVKKVVR